MTLMLDIIRSCSYGKLSMGIFCVPPSIPFAYSTISSILSWGSFMLSLMYLSSCLGEGIWMSLRSLLMTVMLCLLEI